MRINAAGLTIYNLDEPTDLPGGASGRSLRQLIAAGRARLVIGHANSYFAQCPNGYRIYMMRATYKALCRPCQVCGRLVPDPVLAPRTGCFHWLSYEPERAHPEAEE